MTTLFKIIGLVLILSVCTAVGFLKALSLKARVVRLREIKSGLFTLKEKLRLHGGDKSRLLNDCFLSPPESFTELDNTDLLLWKEFLKDFGMSDTAAEYQRCESYITLFDAKITDAQKSFDEQQKLYKSLGFLGGLFVCIFLL